MIQRILIPVDFSETSASAAEYGCALATRLGADVTLLNVYSSGIVALPDAVFAPTLEESQAIARAAQTHVEALAMGLERDGLIIHCETAEGLPADAIAAWSERKRPDLIVMGTHGRRGLSHLLLGSVAEHTLRYAPCPVLTVGQKCAAPSQAVAL
jgi:nucleotide-binding universal stress UspA family protein